MKSLKTKLLTSAAALVMGSASAMGVDVSGVYSTSGPNGQPIGIELHGDGTVQGAIHMGGRAFPLAARESNGQMQGVWQAPDGTRVPFAAAVDGGGNLQLQTNGVRYVCTRAGNGTAGDRVAVPEQRTARPGAGATGTANARAVQEGVFTFPVPAGWSKSASTNEVFVARPDGKLAYGFVGLERIQAMSATDFIGFITNRVYGHRDLRILDVRPIQYPGASQAVEARVSFTHSSGVPLVGWARVATVASGGTMNAYMLVTCGAPDTFDAAARELQALAEQIQVTDGSAAFDRARATAVIGQVQNRPMDHGAVTGGYWDRTRRTDEAMRRDSDVRRDSYVSTDPSTGTAYHHTGGAYDPARGGVVNPERPTELLTPEPHWQGR